MGRRLGSAENHSGCTADAGQRPTTGRKLRQFYNPDDEATGCAWLSYATTWWVPSWCWSTSTRTTTDDAAAGDTHDDTTDATATVAAARDAYVRPGRSNDDTVDAAPGYDDATTRNANWHADDTTIAADDEPCNDDRIDDVSARLVAATGHEGIYELWIMDCGRHGQGP